MDCSALASPRFEGREGKELGTDIYNVLNSVYCQGATAVSNLSKLCIVAGKHCWLLNIDIVILECSAGSLYDIISLAVKAALFDTQVCSVKFRISGIHNIFQKIDSEEDFPSKNVWCPL